MSAPTLEPVPPAQLPRGFKFIVIRPLNRHLAWVYVRIGSATAV